MSAAPSVTNIGVCMCGKRLTAIDDHEAALMHEAPACRQFLELSVLKFLETLRLSRGIKEKP